MRFAALAAQNGKRDGDGFKPSPSLLLLHGVLAPPQRRGEETCHFARRFAGGDLVWMGIWKGRSMQTAKLALIAILSAGGISLGSLAAQAAPGAVPLSESMAAVGDQAKPQEIAYRRCWWRNGRRHCHRYGSPYRGYGYRYYGPHAS